MNLKNVTRTLLAAVMACMTYFSAYSVKPVPLNSQKIAEYSDSRACSYYLVKHSDYYTLYKVSEVGKSGTINNPYNYYGDEVSVIKDAKRIGDYIYVINTAYREGDNVACLNTKTGKWTNPVEKCAQCKFLDGNKLLVMHSYLVREGSRPSENKYEFTEDVITLSPYPKAL